MRIPITNKIKPETNLIVFPIMSLSFIINHSIILTNIEYLQHY